MIILLIKISGCPAAAFLRCIMRRLDIFRRNKTDHDRIYLKVSLCIFLVAAALILFEKIIGHLPNIGGSISTLFHYLNGLISPFLLGFAIAYVMNPFMKFFERHFIRTFKYCDRHRKTTRSLCILLNYFIIIGGTVWIVIYLLPELKESILSLAIQVPDYSTNLNQRIQTLFDQIPFIDSEDVNTVINRFLKPIQELSQDVPELIETIIGNLYGFGRATLNFIMAIFIAFYMLFDKEGFGFQAHKIVYALTSQEKSERFFQNVQRINHIFQDFIVGKAIDSLLIGIIAFIGMSLIHAPFPLILSLIIGVTNMIPYFGPFIGAIPAIIITLLIDPLLAIWVGIFILILQQFDGNFLGPKILGDSLDLSPLWIILAVVVGGALMGPLGMFIGVPIFATVKTFGGEYISRLYERKYSVSDPLHCLDSKEEETEPNES